eukprot:2424797-Alexandrium_andersonii.AAC.1
MYGSRRPSAPPAEPAAAPAMEGATQASQSTPEDRVEALLRATSPVPSEMGRAAPAPEDVPLAA